MERFFTQVRGFSDQYRSDLQDFRDSEQYLDSSFKTIQASAKKVLQIEKRKIRPIKKAAKKPRKRELLTHFSPSPSSDITPAPFPAWNYGLIAKPAINPKRFFNPRAKSMLLEEKAFEDEETILYPSLRNTPATSDNHLRVG